MTARNFGDIPANDNIDATDVLYGGSATPGLSDATDVEEAIDILHSDVVELQYEVNTGISNRLLAWHAAFGDRDSEPAKIVIIGDSITETYWPNHFIDMFQNQAISPQGARPYWSNIDSVFALWDSVGGTLVDTLGLSGYAREHDAATNEDSQNEFVDCDALEVFYTVQKTGGSDLQIYVDGVLETTINTTDAGISGTYESGRSWSSGSLTYGDHTVRVRANGTGSAIVDGVFVHRGTLTSNIQTYNAGHAGRGVVYHSPSNVTGLWDSLSAIQPHLVIVFCGTTDYAWGLSTFTSKYNEFMDELETRVPNSDYLLIAPYATQNRTDSGWSTWRDVIYQISEERGCEFLDLFELMGDVGSNYDIHDLSDDNIHPNTRGSHVISSAIFAEISYEATDSPFITADGSRNFYTNSISGVSASGWTLGDFFGQPYLTFKSSPSDVYPVVTLSGDNAGETLMGGLFFGPGGSDTIVDTGFQRGGAGVLTFLNSTRLSDLVDPVDPQDAVTRAWVESPEPIDNLNPGSSLMQQDSYVSVVTYGSTPVLEKYTVGDLHLRDVSSENSDVTLTDDNHLVVVDASSGNVTVSLPASVSGLEFIIKRTDASGNSVTVEGFGATPELIDGSSTKSLSSQYESVHLIGDGAGWHIV